MAILRHFSHVYGIIQSMVSGKIDPNWKKRFNQEILEKAKKHEKGIFNKMLSFFDRV